VSTFHNAEDTVEQLIVDNAERLITPEKMRDTFQALIDACFTLQARVETLWDRVDELRDRIEALENP
jgi:polyhydroxyalkanoate synthesis regulator phasin